MVTHIVGNLISEVVSKLDLGEKKPEKPLKPVDPRCKKCQFLNMRCIHNMTFEPIEPTSEVNYLWIQLTLIHSISVSNYVKIYFKTF